MDSFGVSGGFEDRQSSVEHSGLGTHESEVLRGQEAERVGDVHDFQDSQEMRAFPVGSGRFDDDDLSDTQFRECRVGTEDARTPFADDGDGAFDRVTFVQGA